MSKESKYEPRDIQFIERIFLLGLKEYALTHPTNTEVDFLEHTIAAQRKKIDTLKTEWYQTKAASQTPVAFYEQNLKKQNIYLDLLLERKKIHERKVSVKK